MERTIAAISTAYGEAGIGIVRMSGPAAKEIAEKIFVPAKAAENFKFRPRFMHYGSIADPETKEILDEVLCVFMKAPHTYTGEDMVEIQCHGSIVSVKNILALCLKMGAEPADRGEFTKLAFLNGRIDLSQAEAVIDLIKARTDKGFDAALAQMQGSLSEKIKGIRSELMDLLVLLTVNMDYPDEDIEIATYGKISESLKSVKSKLDVLLEGSKEGKILREGLGIAIAGKPNVGKSSLMNIFLGEHRSIVTDIPGTTRDTIEEQISLRGIPVRLIDTAGIHDSEDIVESIGIERSKDAVEKSDMVLLLLDSSRPLSEDDIFIMKALEERPCIAVLNKSDLEQKLKPEEILKYLPSAEILTSSLINEEGVEQIKDAIERKITGGKVRRESDSLVTNTRHIQLIRKSVFEIEQALEMAESREAMDFIEINANAAFGYLGEITGDTASGEIINEVFARFCLGK